MLTVNGLVAAEAVMIPMQCRVLRAGGSDRSGDDAAQGGGNLNPVLQIEGLLRTMFDPRMTLMQQVSGELESHFGDKVLQEHHSTQRPPGRGALIRQARHRVRPRLERCAGVSGAGAGNA